MSKKANENNKSLVQNVVFTGCEVPADLGTIYYGDGTEVQGLPPGDEGQVLTTHGTSSGPTWEDPEKALNWKGPWSGATAYVVDDVVERNGSSYVCISNNTNSEPPSANWQLLAQKGSQGPTGSQGPQGIEGLNWRGAWNSSTSYVIDDVVERNGSSYVAVSNNTNDAPPSSSWALVAQKGDQGSQGAQGPTGSQGPQGDDGPQGDPGMNWLGAWSSSTSYVIDDVVQSNGSSYIAIANHSNSQPPSANWQLVAQKGDQGATGAQGATGSQGPQGETGPQGPAGSAGPGSNLVYNAAFRFFQRQTPGTLTSRANGSYGPDRWYLLGDSGASDIQSVRDDADSTQANACRIKNNNAASKHTGIAQVLPASDTFALRGKTIIFQGVAKTSSASRAMRAAIIEWTGSQDAVAFGGSVGRDPVLDWTSGTYTAGNFFRNTSLTVVAVSASFTPGTSYAAFSVSGTVSTSATNLILMVWEESATGAAATWSLSKLGLFEGNTAQSWIPSQFGIDFAHSAPFYQKSYPLDTVPGTTSIGGGVRFWTQVGIGTSSSGNLARGTNLAVPAYKSAPTFTLYSPATGASGAIRNVTQSGDRTNVSANDTSSTGFRDIQCATSGTTQISKEDVLEFHWTMDSEL